MYSMTHKAPNPQTSGQRLHTLAVRTYQQIATVLEEREGKPISADRVAHICKMAEWKIVDAVEADPVLGKRYRSVSVAGIKRRVNGSRAGVSQSHG